MLVTTLTNITCYKNPQNVSIHYIIVYHGISNDTVEFSIVFPPSARFAKHILNASSKARESA